MGHFQPRTVMQLVDVLNDVCRSLKERTGHPVSDEMKETLAKWIISQSDSGISDPEKLSAAVLDMASKSIGNRGQVAIQTPAPFPREAS